MDKGNGVTYRYGYQRHYYSPAKRFEQSVDVYKPVFDNVENDEAPSLSSLQQSPLIVLVVGSAWLGHRSFIYTVTSWWNSSCPKTIAQLGYVCVCVRHRGAFPQLSFLSGLGSPYLLLIIIAGIGLASLCGIKTLDQSKILVAILQVASVSIIIGMSISFAGRGAAQFEDMLEDVADALVWVEKNEQQTNLTPTIANGYPNSNNGGKRRPPLVFGGYSSGGHVAACLMQRSDILQNRGLPPSEQYIDAALFLSAVLAVRPPPQNQYNRSKETNAFTAINHSSSSHPPPAQWLTNMIVCLVFGKCGASQLPSPLEGEKKPRIPHVLIGCRREVFGLPWFDLFFCSEEFSHKLTAESKTSNNAISTDSSFDIDNNPRPSPTVPVRFVEINCANHWTILYSPALMCELRIELLRLEGVILQRKRNDNVHKGEKYE